MKSKYTGTKYEYAREMFDSDEELEFYCWLKESEKFGLITDIRHEPKTFELSDRATIRFKKHLKTKTKMVDKFILHPHVYTPDFDFFISNDKLRALNFFVPNIGGMMVVDVKGGFNKSGDRFSVNQKWVWFKYGVYVQKIVPFTLFLKTWVPEVCRLTPKRREPALKYVGCKTITEFMETT